MITKKIKIDDRPLSVEVANTSRSRARGLMGRRSMGSDGMLFVLDDKPATFHMRNTYIPLDIVYFDAERMVIKTDSMEPKTGHSKCAKPTRFALELPAGTAKKMNIKPGSKLTIESRQHLQESYDDVIKLGIKIRVNINGPTKPTMTDILTDIRAIPNVVTANQMGSKRPAPERKNMVILDIGFISDSEFGISDLRREVLALRGVDMFRAITLDGEPYVSHKTEALIRQLVIESLQADN